MKLWKQNWNHRLDYFRVAFALFLGGGVWNIKSTSSFYFIFLYLFIGVKLLYNVVLVSAVQWSESAICIPISPPSWTSLLPFHQHLGHHRAPSWAPCALQQVPLAICFTHGGVFMANLTSQFIPPSPSPTVSTCPFSTSLSLFLPYR